MRETRTTELHHPKGNEMNKLTKGAIATAAGVILLMGGAGTLAYWNDSDNVLARSEEHTSELQSR